MDKARGKLQKAKTAGMMTNRFEAYVYKPKKKEVVVPFGLEMDTSSLLGEIVASDASLSESVKGLMAQAKAAGTMVNYGCTTRKFAAFCKAKQYT
jgi:hypothetical protein